MKKKKDCKNNKIKIKIKINDEKRKRQMGTSMAQENDCEKDEDGKDMKP